MNVDDLLRGLLFREFRIGRCRFDFLEGLLAVCITGVGCMLRTPFETGLPHWLYLLAEWYLAVMAAVFILRCTYSRRRALGTYGILLILPTVVAEGTILRQNACLGALFFLCALLFLGRKQGEEHPWMFTILTAALLLWSVQYIGLLFACMVLWKQERLKAEQLLILSAAGGTRFLSAYRAWFQARYTLVTFHWPNIYEILGKEAVQEQLFDPLAVVGFFLTLGLMIFAVWLFCQGETDLSVQEGQAADIRKEMVQCLRLFLFFGLAAGYFLPYMDQSYGYLYCILAVLYFMLEPSEFLTPMLLQIVAFAGYQECFHGESMMPMTVFSVIQLLIMSRLGMRIMRDTGVQGLCGQKNWHIWTD